LRRGFDSLHPLINIPSWGAFEIMGKQNKCFYYLNNMLLYGYKFIYLAFKQFFIITKL